jgi:hypothetical protein
MINMTPDTMIIRAEYTVTDGTRTIGTIIRAAGKFTAVSAVAGQIGVFGSTRDAMRAISQAAGARPGAS